MWLPRYLKAAKDNGTEKATEPSVDQGIYYLYVIIFLQIAFVLGLLGVVMIIGSILATPAWVFLVAIGAGIWGCAFIYRKARRQLQKLRDTFQRVDLSDRNYQISFMGGFVTMRVAQNSRHFLPASPHQAPLIEAEPIDTTVVTR